MQLGIFQVCELPLAPIAANLPMTVTATMGVLDLRPACVILVLIAWTVVIEEVRNSEVLMMLSVFTCHSE